MTLEQIIEAYEIAKIDLPEIYETSCEITDSFIHVQYKDKIVDWYASYQLEHRKNVKKFYDAVHIRLEIRIEGVEADTTLIESFKDKCTDVADKLQLLFDNFDYKNYYSLEVKVERYNELLVSKIYFIFYNDTVLRLRKDIKQFIKFKTIEL